MNVKLSCKSSTTYIGQDMLTFLERLMYILTNKVNK